MARDLLCLADERGVERGDLRRFERVFELLHAYIARRNPARGPVVKWSMGERHARTHACTHRKIAASSRSLASRCSRSA
jgi:hypothetical protein